MKQGNCYSRRKFNVFFRFFLKTVTYVVPLPLLAVYRWIGLCCTPPLPPLPLGLLPNQSICDMHIRHVCQCHVDTRPDLYRWVGGKNRFNESKAINQIPTTHTPKYRHWQCTTEYDTAQLVSINFKVDWCHLTGRPPAQDGKPRNGQEEWLNQNILSGPSLPLNKNLIHLPTAIHPSRAGRGRE